MHIQRRQQGFTLIEIAIVLVIIGLLLGGILKGQELITSARVRNLISQQDGIKAAFYGFQDRYRAFPGDYKDAPSNLQGAPKGGDGNGRIVNGTGDNAVFETTLAWDHLSRSGFLNGNYIYADSGTATDTSTPKNPYGSYVGLAYDNNYGKTPNTSTTPERHNLKTGSQIPVEIAAEVDRKTDDGNPMSGSFQFSTFSTDTGNAPTKAPCVAASDAAWNLTSGTSSVNCGGTTLL